MAPSRLTLLAVSASGRVSTKRPVCTRHRSIHKTPTCHGHPSPWAASVEAITPIDAVGALVTEEVLVENVNAADGGDLYGYGPVPTEQRALLDRHYAALPAVIAPGESGRHAALIVRGSTPGATGFEALAIDYRLGPFAFRVIHHVALHACLGATVKERMCPEYD
jgi:hypothetical protein